MMKPQLRERCRSIIALPANGGPRKVMMLRPDQEIEDVLREIEASGLYASVFFRFAGPNARFRP